MNYKIILLLVAFLAPIASQALEITALGGLNMPSPTYSKFTLLGVEIDPKASQASGISAAVYASFPIAANMMALETGFAYLTSKYTLTFTSISATKLELTRLQIPLLLRLIKLPIISFGAGLYYEMGLGNVKSTDTTTSVVTTSTSGGDYGALADLRFRIPIGPKFGFVLDGRYNFGLAESTLPGTTSKIKNKAIQAMGGVSIML